MREQQPLSSRMLEEALASWNARAQHRAVPILANAHESYHALRRLVELSQCCRPLSEGDIARAASGDGQAPLDPVRALREMASQLDELESILAAAAAQLNRACALGENVVRDLRILLPERGRDASIHLPEDDASDPDLPDTHLLARMIEAQRAEITALQMLASTVEPAAGSADSERRDTIKIQDIQAFVQESPISERASIPAYYQRLLEAANSAGRKRVPMGELLTLAGLISERQLVNALERQRGDRRKPLGSLLVDLGYTTEDAIAQALAAQLSLPYVVLANEFVREGALSKIPAHLARRHTCFPLNFTDQRLTVAMANPLDLIALEDLHIASSMQIRPCVAARSEIQKHIRTYYV